MSDINECPSPGVDTHNCSGNASCTDTDGSYTCMCNAGYTGDGFVCESMLWSDFWHSADDYIFLILEKLKCH